MKKPISQVTGSEKFNKKERKKRFRRHMMEVAKVMVFTMMLSAPSRATAAHILKQISIETSPARKDSFKNIIKTLIQLIKVGYNCLLRTSSEFDCIIASVDYF